MKKIEKTSKWSEKAIKTLPSKPKRRAIVYLRPEVWLADMEYLRSFCQKFCEEKNIELLVEPFWDEDEYVNDLTILESPEFNRALAYCKDKKNRVNTLIVAKRNTLGTNTAEYLRCKIDLHREGVEILSISDVESVDSSMEEICAMISEYEQDKKKKV